MKNFLLEAVDVAREVIATTMITIAMLSMIAMGIVASNLDWRW